jgi:phospholipid N-methyltransferase
MLEFIKGSLKLIKNVKKTGALTQTTAQVVQEIIRLVDPNQKQIIVEFGAGPGNITRGILRKMHPESQLLSFEIEEDFLSDLRKIQDKRLTIINDSAEKLDQYMKGQKAALILSSIPITIMPKSVYQTIMVQIQRNLKEDGSYHQVLYSNQKKKFSEFFPQIDTKWVFNIPMATIHTCRN